MAQLTLPIWIVLWLIVSAIIVFADVGFILLRPHSMAGGIYSHFPLWSMYPLYYSIDRLYADMENSFVRAQTYMNLVENVGIFIGLLIFRFGSRARGMILLLITVSLTLGKTLLYMIHEHCSPATNHPTAHNFPDNLKNYVLLYILPNSLWILFPTLIILNFSGQLRAAIEGGNENKAKSKKN